MISLPCVTGILTLLMGSLATWIGAGLVTSGCNRKDSRKTRPYTINNQASPAKISAMARLE